jgi:hypothetical protein
MEQKYSIAFGLFCLEVTHGRLWWCVRDSRGVSDTAAAPRYLEMIGMQG